MPSPDRFIQSFAETKTNLAMKTTIDQYFVHVATEQSTHNEKLKQEKARLVQLGKTREDSYTNTIDQLAF